MRNSGDGERNDSTAGGAFALYTANLVSHIVPFRSDPGTLSEE